MRLAPGHLRTLLIAVLLLLQLISVTVIMHGVSRQTRERLDDNAEVALTQLTGAVADRTQRFLVPVTQATGMFADLVSTGNIDTDNTELLTRVFLSFLHNNDAINSIYVGEASGRFLLAARNADDKTFELRRIQIAEDGERTIEFLKLEADGTVIDVRDNPDYQLEPSERPWFRLAMQSDGIALTDPYRFFLDGSPGITSTVVLRKPDGSICGVLGIDISILQLSEFVAEVTPHEQASAMILDGGEHIVAYSDINELLNTAGEDGLPTLNDIGDLELQNVMELADSGALLSSLSPANDNVQLQGAGGQTLDARVAVQGDRLLMLKSFSPLADSDDLHWQLAVQIPSETYEAGLVSSIDRRLLIALGVLSLLALSAVAAVMTLTAPVYRLAKDAAVDPLTGALNRREFERRLSERLQLRDQVPRQGRRKLESTNDLVVVMMDLDGFKPVNDGLGHAAGDQMLKTVVERLQAELRSTDIVARLGGDEFVAVMTVDVNADLEEIAERLRHHAVGRTFTINKQEVSIGVTAGIARHKPGESMHSLLARADEALIAGKLIAKNRSYLAEEEQLNDNAA